MGLFSNNIESLLITIAVAVGIFLLLREVFCWYWKINQRISLQKEQIELLKKIVSAGKNDLFDWEKKDSSKSENNRVEISVDTLYHLIEEDEDNIDVVAKIIKDISLKTEAQINEFLNKYEQEKGKTVYQHLFDKIGNKEEVDKVLAPIIKYI
ncbi:MAG: hypothetical protein K9G70_13485 [Prolixibacteraceae bacterium]|nr:hypothetical protein [Prolixibacteraceae bacterium]